MKGLIQLQDIIKAESLKASQQRTQLKLELHELKVMAATKAASPRALIGAFMAGFTVVRLFKSKKAVKVIKEKPSSKHWGISLVSRLPTILGLVKLIK